MRIWRKQAPKRDTDGWHWDGKSWQPPAGVEPGWSVTAEERRATEASRDDIKTLLRTLG